MTQELQDKLKLVFESDFVPDHHRLWRKKHKEFNVPWETVVIRLKYHTSWEWQIPVWSKLCESNLVDRKEFILYNRTVRDNQPEKGFEIIVTIIQRIQQ